MNGGFACWPVMGATQGLPINGYHLGRQDGSEGLHPIEETPLELHRIEPGEDPPKGIMRGNP